MKFGWFCMIAGAVSILTTLYMLVNGTVFARGILVGLGLIIFGGYLVRRARYREDIKRWARDNPEEARRWLEATKGGEYDH